MARKLILAVLLVLLAGVQAQAASCDVRCSIVEASMCTSRPGHPALGGVTMAHCHGMPPVRQEAAKLISKDCTAPVCNLGWAALPDTGNHDLSANVHYVDAVFLDGLPVQAPKTIAAATREPRARGGGPPQDSNSILRI